MSGLTTDNRQQRLGIITASAFPKILVGGRTRASVLYRISRERATGESQEKAFTSKAMADGVEAEPKILNAFENFLNYEKGLKELKIIHNSDLITREWNGCVFGATPDGLLNGEPVEVKFPKWANFEKQVQENPPEDYVWQVKFQCWVLGKKRGDLVIGRETVQGEIEIAPWGIDLTPGDEARIEKNLQEAEEYIRLLDECPEGEKGVVINPQVAAVATAKRYLMEIGAAYKAAQAALKAEFDAKCAPHQSIVDDEEAICLFAKGEQEAIPPGVKRTPSRVVVVSDIDALPVEMVKRTPKLTELKRALGEGEIIAGATIEEKINWSVRPDSADSASSIAPAALKDFQRVLDGLTEAATGGDDNKGETP